MKQIFLFLTIILCMVVPVIAQDSNGLEHEIDQVFSAWDSLNKPGIAAGIIKDGEVIYLKGFGSANIRTETAITPETKFQLGAMSKQFTSLAILLLVDQGKIALQEDILTYLPELPNYNNIITVAHLLNHCSGLDDISRLSEVIYGTSTIATQAKAIEMIAAQKTLSYKPGTDFSFHESITESVLMAEIVARSTGGTFADFVKANIFEPLGMQHSLIRDDDQMIVDNAAIPYQKEAGKAYKKYQVPSSVVGPINAYCSAEDLAKWYKNYTHPTCTVGRLIQKLDAPVKLTNGETFSYYWGVMAIGREFTHPERGLPIFWNFGLEGGFGANVFRYIDQNITTFVLGNGNQYNGAAAMNAITPFVEDLYLLPPVIDYASLKTTQLSPDELKSFEGHYWFEKAGYASRIFVKKDTLRSQWIFTDRTQTLLPISENTFQQVAANEDVRLFKFKKHGEVQTILFSFNESKPDIMESYVPIKPDAHILQSYVGAYYHAAYGSVFTIEVEDDKVILRNLNHRGIEFRPVKADVFTSATMFMPALSFFRDDSKAVRGFKINADGIRDLVFEKVPKMKH